MCKCGVKGQEKGVLCRLVGAVWYGLIWIKGGSEFCLVVPSAEPLKALNYNGGASCRSVIIEHRSNCPFRPQNDCGSFLALRDGETTMDFFACNPIRWL